MPRGRKARPASGHRPAGRPPRIPSIVPAGTPVILSGGLAADLSYVVQQQQVQAARVRILLGPVCVKGALFSLLYLQMNNPAAIKTAIEKGQSC